MRATSDKMANHLSNLAYIDVQTTNPFTLFNEWKAEATDYLPSCQNPNIINLATSSGDCCVTNRSVVVLEFPEDGFVFLTCRESKKAEHIKENPNVAATFLWIYTNGRQENVARQVRVTGVCEEMGEEFSKRVFDGTPTFRKITYYIGQQDEEVIWDELKRNHDQILKEVENGRVLEMPKTSIVYKLTPWTMEFYHAYDNFIGDRVLFTRQESTWCHKHLTP